MVHGGVNSLSALVGLVALFIMFGVGPGDEGEFGFVLGLVLVITTVVLLLWGLLPLIAGYGLLRYKAWARTATLVASFVSALLFPFGSVLCVYSLWFLLGEGRKLHDEARGLGARNFGALNGGEPFGWSNAREGRAEHVPPSQMPNWRDDD